MQGQKSPMPIKLDAGDSFALDLELMLLVNSNRLCKCNGHHAWPAVQVCGWVRPSGEGSSLEESCPEGTWGFAHPSHLFLHTQKFVCLAAVGMEGELPPAKTIFHTGGPRSHRELSK